MPTEEKPRYCEGRHVYPCKGCGLPVYWKEILILSAFDSKPHTCPSVYSVVEGIVDTANCGYSCRTVSSSDYDDILSELLPSHLEGKRVRLYMEVLS